MRSFPTGAGFVDALHHPETCLTDPRLSGARVEATEGGWPRPRSGAAASVFRLDAVDGARYAVKCFTRPGDGQHQRYSAIAAHLAGERSDWQITFEYQEEGILVEGGSWPILVMEWVDGATDLSRAVTARLGRPAELGRLAQRFAAVCADLARREIAHGDLQHGNVLVTRDGAIRLIDYDGMWVPELAGRPGVEFGQPNYQHPGRRQEHAGPRLDHFSSWVIYVSLLATAVDADLWHRLDGGDECLLFRAADFAEPDASAAFAALSRSDDPVVRAAAARLAEFAGYADPADVPPVDADAFPVPRRAGRRGTGERRPRWTGSGIAGWTTAGRPPSSPGTAGTGTAAKAGTAGAGTAGAGTGTGGAPAGPAGRRVRPGRRRWWRGAAGRRTGGRGGTGGAGSRRPGRAWRRGAAPIWRRGTGPIWSGSAWRRSTASVWSGRPWPLRALRSWFLLRQGRIRPGGPPPPQSPTVGRWLGMTAAVLGAGVLLGLIFDDGAPSTPSRVPPGFSAPGYGQQGGTDLTRPGSLGLGETGGYPTYSPYRYCAYDTTLPGCTTSGSLLSQYIRCRALLPYPPSALSSLIAPPPSLAPAIKGKTAPKPKRKPKPRPTATAAPTPTSSPADPCRSYLAPTPTP